MAATNPKAFAESADAAASKANLEAASNASTKASDFVAGNPKPPASSGPNDSGKGDEGEGAKAKPKSPSPKSPAKRSKKSVPHPYHQLIKNKPPSKQIAARTVLLASGGSLAIIAVANFAGSDKYKGEGTLFRAIGGTIIVGVGLLIIAEFEPDLASMFSLLVLVKVLLDNGDFVAKGMNAVTKAKPGDLVKNTKKADPNMPPPITGKRQDSGFQTA